MVSFNPLSSDRPLTKRIFMLFQVLVLPCAPFVAYLVGMVLGLKGDEVPRSVLYFLPPVIIICGNVYPHLLIGYLYRTATAFNPNDLAWSRLARILKFPWRVAFYGQAGSFAIGAFIFSLEVCLWFGKSLWLVALGTVIGVAISLLLALPVGIIVERWIMPLALEEQGRNPSLRVLQTSFFWLRQSWFLPYAFIVCALSIIVLGGVIVGVQTGIVQQQLVSQLMNTGQHQAAALVSGLTSSLLSELSVPALVLAIMMISLPAVSAWMLARRQEQGSQAVLQAIEYLSIGKVRPPEWVSTDEIGDLAFGLNSIIGQLSAVPRALENAANQLAEAGATLRNANDNQRQALTIQATTIQETNVTAQEIKQTSDLTAQRAEAVLNVVTHAEELGRAGSNAIEQTIAGFSVIRDSVHAIRTKMERLHASAQQIGNITEAVKDLADQSNMLALNAAIEAVRSGEHGKGFGVVAREIRNLADQSIRATGRIRNILEEVGSAINDAVAMTDVGAAQVEGGLDKVKTSGDSLRQLSQMVHESSSAVRQITAAVSQQNSGFAQIFTAIADMSRSMDQSLERLESTQEAAGTLQQVSDQVNQLVRQYRVE
ncbi:methyl-accepting chemotaxis protein [Archangium lipolyticum]|uniref:methyl-accepting chemotaxis protein n=1 Tax=Archangium lipolyticum TaxID=2970465 RepID=UPI002149C08C|nr:methyl-accepting chemotaxis protein [Archangium lipolyticum]